MKDKTVYLGVFMMIFLWVSDVHAVTIGQVALHGFGGWAYGRTDNENWYLVGNEDGNYDHVSFSLNISTNPYERLSVHVQPSYIEDSDGHEVGLDYAFAEWFVSEALSFRVGKVKAPFMIYTEIYDVGTLRPFFTLPQGVYHEIAAEAYNGVGITGSFPFGSGWEVMYDLYGGELNLQPNRAMIPEVQRFVSVTPIVNDMIGGRLTLQTPVDGLALGFSSYTGDVEIEINDVVQEDYPLNDRYLLFSASAEYVTDRWLARSEYLMQKESPKMKADVAYIETAYRFTEHWQAAARYEFADFNTEMDLGVDTLLEHEEIALGLNYWFNPNLVFKLSYHIVNGNRFASPGDPENYLIAAQRGFDEETHLILIGTQFSF